MSRDDEEPKKRNINFKVGSNFYERINNYVENIDHSRSEFIRSAVREAIPDRETTLRLFASDLLTLTGTDEQNGVHEIIETEVWEYLNDDEHRSAIREDVFSGRLVYVVGQGSSASVAQWLSQQLRKKENIPTIASSAAEFPDNLLQPDDVLIGISQSGETASVIDLIGSYEDPVTVAVTQPKTSLSLEAEHTIQLPPFDKNERLSPYATKSTIGQIAVLQMALLDHSPDLKTLEARFKALDIFIDNHLGAEQSPRLKYDSEIALAVNTVEENNDLQSVPVFGHTTQQSAGVGAEMALKFPELVNIYADCAHLIDIRDRVLNLFYHNEAYLVGIIPELNDHRSWADIVYRDEESIYGQLLKKDDDILLPIIAFSFGDRRDIQNDIQKRSKYGGRSVISIDTYPPDPKSRSLIHIAGIQLFAFGILSELRRKADDQLDYHVIEDVYTRDFINWDEL